ncbi:sporulation protein YlmC with PRC-barrel domain [Nakamurella sp. UYEF19]|uniref:PRC-barrel domain-containing protein n=1 Tax=Nakamurella sp. UYEF19 TaxID=1756392 RepID=UPI00339407C9
MSTLVRASELAQRVVVTYGGEDVAQIKDIVYAANGGEIGAFTLAGRGLFAGPLKVGLPWAAVVGLGQDAVIIESEDALVPLADLFDAADGPVSSGRADILKSEVLTDAGTSLGRVSDVIIGIGDTQGGQADVVGYQIDPAETLGRGKLPLLIPLPDTLSASGEHLMVPAAAANYLTDDLASFGSAIDAFRSQLGGAS